LMRLTESDTKMPAGSYRVSGNRVCLKLSGYTMVIYGMADRILKR
jgi:hypothetical protein